MVARKSNLILLMLTLVGFTANASGQIGYAKDELPILPPALGETPRAAFERVHRERLYKKGLRQKFVGSTVEEPYTAYVGDVLSRIEKHSSKNYPAQIKGLHGTVRVTFSVKSDGTLDALEIDQTSGYPALDRAVKNFIEKAAPFAPFPVDVLLVTDVLSITRSFTLTSTTFGSSPHSTPIKTSIASGTETGNYYRAKEVERERARDEVVARVRVSYVDPVDEDKLTQGDLGELVRAVDPEGEYLDQDAVSELKSSHTNVAGIGLEFGAHGGGLKIVAPLDDSPAARAGLKAGDLVVAIDDAPVKGLTLLDAAKRLRGEAGTPVKITILREGESRPQDVTMRREFIRQQSVRVSELEPGYFHIRIRQLTNDTLATLATQLKAIYAYGEPKGLVLDLRDNTGGLLHCAAGIAAVFLPSNVLVASVSGRSPGNTFDIYAAPGFYVRSGPDPFKALPASVKRVSLVVLVNEVTAAGSEIVAAAFQDYKRAIVVGTRTFGRASIQTIFPLADGAALKLTTARWVTPNKRSVQNSGIVPDEVLLEVPAETTQETPIQKSPLEHALSTLKKATNKE